MATSGFVGVSLLLTVSCDKGAEDQLLDPQYQQPEKASIVGAVTAEDGAIVKCCGSGGRDDQAATLSVGS